MTIAAPPSDKRRFRTPHRGRYVKAPNAEVGDRFGEALALSDDTLAVGSYRERSCRTSIATVAATISGSSCMLAGAVYVYVRSGATWSFQAYRLTGSKADDRVATVR